MRIALIAGLPYTNPTAEAVLRGLGAAYRRLGHDVHTAAMGRSRSVRRRVLTAILKGADAVHFHHFYGHLEDSSIDFWSTQRRKQKFAMVTFQSYGDPWGRRPDRAELALLSEWLSSVRQVTALSFFCAKQMEKDMPALAGRIAIVPDGYALEKALHLKTRRGGPAVLCVARNSPAKGINVLLDAWKRLGGRRDATLRIAGPDPCPPDRRVLRKVLDMGMLDSVKVLGKLSRRRLWSEFERSLFVVHPAIYESFGMALIEAMGAGKAVVATRSGGPQETVVEGRTGLLVPAGDAKKLASGMRKLLDSPQRRRDLEAGAIREARKYHWDTIARRYLALMPNECGEYGPSVKGRA